MSVKKRYWIYPSIILAATLAYLLSRWIFLLGGRAVGSYLIRKSSRRRKALIAKLKLDEEREAVKTRLSPRSDDGDWEKVESYIGRTGNDAEKAEDDDWEGIIGFFHPFWYVLGIMIEYLW